MTNCQAYTMSWASEWLHLERKPPNSIICIRTILNRWNQRYYRNFHLFYSLILIESAFWAKRKPHILSESFFYKFDKCNQISKKPLACCFFIQCWRFPIIRIYAAIWKATLFRSSITMFQSTRKIFYCWSTWSLPIYEYQAWGIHE